MIKSKEISDPTSCLNRSRDDEPIFVLTARDAAAPDAIRAWAQLRIGLGKNLPDDPHIVEALDLACQMENKWRDLRCDRCNRLLGRQFGDPCGALCSPCALEGDPGE